MQLQSCPLAIVYVEVPEKNQEQNSCHSPRPERITEQQKYSDASLNTNRQCQQPSIAEKPVSRKDLSHIQKLRNGPNRQNEGKQNSEICPTISHESHS